MSHQTEISIMRKKLFFKKGPNRNSEFDKQNQRNEQFTKGP